MKKILCTLTLTFLLTGLLVACSGTPPPPEPTKPAETAAEPTPAEKVRGEKTAEEATLEPTEEAAPEPTEEATPEPTEEATPEPTEEAAPEPTEEPAPEPTEEATPEPTEEPTPEPTEEAAPEPTEEAAPEPTEEPAPEPTEEAVAEQEIEYVTDLAGDGWAPASFASGAFPPSFPVDSRHQDTWFNDECETCHSKQIDNAPEIPHDVWTSNCRSCHLPSTQAEEAAIGDWGPPAFSSSAFPPPYPPDSRHGDAWFNEACQPCHEQQQDNAPEIPHDVWTQNCRSCHVPGVQETE